LSGKKRKNNFCRNGFIGCVRGIRINNQLLKLDVAKFDAGELKIDRFFKFKIIILNCGTRRFTPGGLRGLKFQGIQV
jgi:hypothetical protein